MALDVYHLTAPDISRSISATRVITAAWLGYNVISDLPSAEDNTTNDAAN